MELLLPDASKPFTPWRQLLCSVWLSLGHPRASSSSRGSNLDYYCYCYHYRHDNDNNDRDDRKGSPMALLGRGRHGAAAMAAPDERRACRRARMGRDAATVGPNTLCLLLVARLGWS